MFIILFMIGSIVFAGISTNGEYTPDYVCGGDGGFGEDGRNGVSPDEVPIYSDIDHFDY